MKRPERGPGGRHRPPHRSLRVLIADRHAVVRAGLRVLVDAEADMEVVAEAADGAEAARLAASTRPDVAVVDIGLKGARKGRAIADVLRRAPRVKLLALTAHDDPASRSAATMAGAHGYVLKGASEADLVAAIRAVGRGVTFFPAPPHARRAGAKAGIGILSHREQQVLALLAEGNTNVQAAASLGLSVKTVETYRSRLKDKLGLRTRAEIFRFARESGVLEGGER